MSPVAFGYAQARIQARLAELPTPLEWDRLSASRGLGSFLEDARGGALRHWVEGFSAQSPADEIERGLRALADGQVAMVALWSPPSWRQALLWTAWLPWLPLLEHLEQGGRAPRWAMQDPLAAAWLDQEGRLAKAPHRPAGLGALTDGAAPVPISERWLGLWRGLWPSQDDRSRATLETLVVLTQRHLLAFRAAPPEAAWGLRAALRRALRQRLHAWPLQPAGVFAFLALVWLDLERLRAELLGRALFSESVSV